MAKYDIANMYIANKMRDASDAALTARVSALESDLATLETMSTTERVVGKWIDGRDIYEKVVDLGTLPNENTKNVAHGITDADMFIEVSGVINGTIGGALVSANIAYPGSPTSQGYAENITLIVSGSNLVVGTGTDRTDFSGYAILRYVKVTT